MAQSRPIGVAGHAYDPETIDLLRALLEETWATLSQEQQAETPRAEIAGRLLTAAATGERDPDVLRARALDGAASPERASRMRGASGVVRT